MNQTEKSQPKPSNAQYVRNIGLFSVGAQVGVVTIGVVVLSLIIGLGLDKLFDTRPIFTVIFILGSAPLALYLTFWIAMRAVKNLNPQDSSPSETAGPVKEEEERE